jgi:hypothetical protein
LGVSRRQTREKLQNLSTPMRCYQGIARYQVSQKTGSSCWLVRMTGKE